MAHAGHIVNASEAERLSKDGQHTFFNFEDVPKIEKYFQSIASQSSVMYEGNWLIEDEQEALDPNKIFQMAFGTDSATT